MFNTETTTLSLYQRTTQTTPIQSLTLYQVYRMIVGEVGSDDLRSLTQRLRSISDPDPKREHDLKRDFKKQNFPAISFGGTFTQRGNQNLIKASNLVCLDFDHIGTGEELESIKERISQETELDSVLLFVSPSGDGLKVVVNVRQEIKSDSDFKEVFKSLRRFCQEVLNLPPDESRKDISGLCYLPFDEKAILRTSGAGFDVEKWRPVEAPKPQVPQRQTPLRETMNLSDEPSDYERALIAVEDIESSGIDITSDRKDWRDIGFALATLGESGRDLFHRVSRFYPHYNPQETDKQFSSFLSGQGSGITLNSLFAIARNHGVQMRSSKAYSQRPQKRGKFEPQQVFPQNPISESFNVPQGGQETVSEVQEKPQKQVQDFSWLLTPTTEREMIERGMNLPEAIPTGYVVKGTQNLPQKLLLCAGTLTEIAGATGHGKTLLLMNILLNVARQNPERRFVLFTYEQNSDTILSYLLNIYLNDLNLMKPHDWRSNRILLGEYFSTGRTDNFNPHSLPEFRKRKEMFFKTYIETGRILIKYVESDSQTLCHQIEFLSKQTSVGAVFIDYFQYINPDPEKRFPTRQEALKSICIELKDIANKTGLPVVLACQFNQEVQSPTDVLLNKIGEAGDISRIGAEVWGLWQMGKDIGRKLDNTDSHKVEELNGRSMSIGLNDPFLKGMFIRVLKSRIVESGSEDMFVFRGLTGKISVNDDETGLSVDDWNRPQPTLNFDDDLPE